MKEFKKEHVELALSLLSIHLDGNDRGMIDRVPYKIWEAFVYFMKQIIHEESDDAE